MRWQVSQPHLQLLRISSYLSLSWTASLRPVQPAGDGKRLQREPTDMCKSSSLVHAPATSELTCGLQPRHAVAAHYLVVPALNTRGVPSTDTPPVYSSSPGLHRGRRGCSRTTLPPWSAPPGRRVDVLWRRCGTSPGYLSPSATLGTSLLCGRTHQSLTCVTAFQKFSPSRNMR